ncbi:uncharacterized protein LOC114796677 isoform X2 [Denticeps clupeoides]|nr:uncharacterized protein LOC114796677 isoform X2 [Denticeps clupeoides]
MATQGTARVYFTFGCVWGNDPTRLGEARKPSDVPAALKNKHVGSNQLPSPRASPRTRLVTCTPSSRRVLFAAAARSRSRSVRPSVRRRFRPRKKEGRREGRERKVPAHAASPGRAGTRDLCAGAQSWRV